MTGAKCVYIFRRLEETSKDNKIHENNLLYSFKNWNTSGPKIGADKRAWILFAINNSDMRKGKRQKFTRLYNPSVHCRISKVITNPYNTDQAPIIYV